MITVKDASVLTNTSIKVVDLFNITPTTKYVYLNIFGSNNTVSTTATASGYFVGNSKMLQNTKFGNFSSATILFELKNNEYVSSLYGPLSNIKIQPPTSNYVNLISLATADTVNPGLLFNMDEPGQIVKEMSTSQYSAAVMKKINTVELAPTADNIIATAKSFIGKQWNAQDAWGFVETVSALCGTSLPMSSISAYNKFQTNDKWTVKYTSLAPVGDWKQLIAPGDIILLNDGFMRHSGTAVCVSGSGVNAMVVNTVTTKYNRINTSDISIAPAHLFSTEDVYHYATNVYILSLGSSNTTVPVKATVPVNTPVNNSVPYTINGANGYMYVNPAPDIKLGANQKFSISLSDAFTYSNVKTQVNTSTAGLPSWAKYDAITNIVSGTSPKVASTTEFQLKFKVGSFTGSDPIQIIVNPKQLVDIPNTKWAAGAGNSLSINKECTDTYHYTVKTPDNMNWLLIDQTNGTLRGVPPTSYIGNSYNITVYQQHDALSAKTHIDDFVLTITTPLKLIGLPEY